MTEATEIALISTIGVIGGSLITALIYAYSSRKNNFFQSLKHATEALNITTDELVEAILEAKQLRAENKEKEKQFIELQRNYRTLKSITRKLYKLMQDSKIDAELSEEELELLFDTQPLLLFKEQEQRRQRLTRGKEQ